MAIRRKNIHITQCYHADRLPNAKTDSRSNTTVETLDTVVGVDVLERGGHVQVLGAVGINSLGLKLHTDNLNGLVPCAQTATKGGSGDLLNHTELLAVLLLRDLANTSLRDTGQTKAGTPVGDLANRNGIDTTVDTAETLGAPDAHEGLKRAWWLRAGSCNLVLCDLDCLHASAEAHGGIGLRKTTCHSTRDTGKKVGSAERLGVVFGFRGDEEEDGSFGGGFDPGPRNETLVDYVSSSSDRGPGIGVVDTNIQAHHHAPRCGQWLHRSLQTCWQPW